MEITHELHCQKILLGIARLKDQQKVVDEAERIRREEKARQAAEAEELRKEMALRRKKLNKKAKKKATKKPTKKICQTFSANNDTKIVQLSRDEMLQKLKRLKRAEMSKQKQAHQHDEVKFCRI